MLTRGRHAPEVLQGWCDRTSGLYINKNTIPSLIMFAKERVLFIYLFIRIWLEGENNLSKVKQMHFFFKLKMR